MPTQTAEQYYSLNGGKSTTSRGTSDLKVDKSTPKTNSNKGTYASAKKNDPKLDSYIKDRNNAKKGSSAYNAAQNKINKAYGKGPTNRPVETKADVDKKNEKKVNNTMRGSVDNKKQENPRAQKTSTRPDLRKNDPNKKVGKITSSDTKKKLDAGTFKEDKQATSSERQKVLKERIEAGDKKAGKKAGLKGGLKRKGNRAGKNINKKITGGRKSEKIAKKMSEVDLSTEKGFAKADKLNKKASMVDTKNERKKSKQKLKDIILTASDSPTTFKDFDQMDSKNAKKTAGEDPKKTGPRTKPDRTTELDKKIAGEGSMSTDGPIKYFKQSIKYNVREASNPSLSSSARKHYAENAQHDMKSMGKMDKTMAYKHGAMKGDQSASRIDYANYKGTDKGYHGKTGASHGDQSASKADYMGKSKKGSIISKHMKSN